MPQPFISIGKLKHSLLFQLSYFVLIITVLVLTVLGGFRYQQQSVQLESELDSLLKTSTQFLVTTLRIPIYNFDFDTAETICAAVIQAKEVVYIRVDKATNVDLTFIKNEQGNVLRTGSLLTASEVVRHKEEIIFKGKSLGVVTVGVTKKHLNESLMSTLELVIAQIIILACLLVVLLIALLRYRLVIPVKQLTQVSSRIAQGELEQVIGSYRSLELDELAKTLSSMQTSIKEKIKDLNILRHYLSNIIDSMPSVLIGVNIDGKVTQWNSEAARFTGVCQQKALGQPLAQSFPRLYIEMDQVRDAIKSCQKKTVINRQYLLDGKVRYEDMTIYPLETGGTESAVIRLDDTTEKNTNEIVLRRAQKMEAVGQLTGGIAHDFNNILGIIMGNLQLLEMKLAGNDDALDRIHKALKGTQRGADITRQLLKFSRNDPQETHETQLINVNKVIENIDELVSKSLTVSIEVQTHLSEGIWPVIMNPGDLEDAILNLSLNAKDAMPEGGSLIIETTNKVLDDNYVEYHPESKIGEYVRISVSDDGVGMNEETKSKVLEPFFTTKQQGKGTGLGLSMVYGFIQRAGGHIQIDSELGEGTTFQLFFPRAEENEKISSGKQAVLTELPKGTETILIVDDEEALVDIAAEYLKSVGYKVLVATEAKGALDMIEVSDEIDLVFSDIIMPGNMDGYQLAEAIHKKHPQYKILLTSGFTKNREDLLGSESAFVLKLAENRLHKPYTKSELATEIRRALDDTR